ncbi:MAG TPA: hypothetical protein VK183_00865 [Flavobacterium sp.]|nr:hypothetical protein [Flavobacterium sp.]
MLLLPFIGFGQYSAHEIIRKEMQQYRMESDSRVVVADLDSIMVEFTLRRLLTSQRVFTSVYNNRSQIKLTESEKQQLIAGLRANYTTFWTSEDFHNLKVIRGSDLPDYIGSGGKNAYTFISNPVFIRNETVALVFSATFYGDMQKNGHGYSRLCFYRLQNGEWKSWILMEGGIYN